MRAPSSILTGRRCVWWSGEQHKLCHDGLSNGIKLLPYSGMSILSINTAHSDSLQGMKN